MVHGGELWQRHPHVRAGNELTFGERAADELKSRFGSWAFLIILNTIFLVEVAVHIATRGRFDPGLLYLNLFLSWLAAQQGGALQIAANRGDRISAEVATGTASNAAHLVDVGNEILTLQRQQMEILAEIRALRAQLDDVTGNSSEPGTE